MPKTLYVFSTLTADNEYCYGGLDARGAPVPPILIKGGSNVVDSRTLITPIGVPTAVSEADLERLRTDETFKLHEANGFLTVRSDKVEGEVAASDMQSRSPDAPFTPETIADPAGAKISDEGEDEPTPPRSNRRA